MAINCIVALHKATQLRKVIKILKESESSLLVEMHYYNDIEVLSFIKKWLPYIEIIDNDLLKKELYATLKGYLLK